MHNKQKKKRTVVTGDTCASVYLDHNPEDGESVALGNGLREAVILCIPVDQVQL
ncbi:hypothetical protein DPMN_170973 [Dreissena polymorpha]|uniref:Uncharacterized protein n=1 Tax=Dreissena polymorpha TaxID=45954 RepID=A0A9D4IDQ7_DREPO|nr:hypothetical protein DPMN_170973 [Dreissena polymorpha]